MCDVIMYNFGELKKDIKLNEEVLKSFDGVQDDEEVPLLLVLALTSAFGTTEEIVEMAMLTNKVFSSLPEKVITLEATLVFFLAPLGAKNQRMRALVQEKLQGLVPTMQQVYNPVQ